MAFVQLPACAVALQRMYLVWCSRSSVLFAVSYLHCYVLWVKAHTQFATRFYYCYQTVYPFCWFNLRVDHLQVHVLQLSLEFTVGATWTFYGTCNVSQVLYLLARSSSCSLLHSLHHQTNFCGGTFLHTVTLTVHVPGFLLITTTLLTTLKSVHLILRCVSI